MRIVVIFLLCFIIINLFIGLFHIIRGKDSKDKGQRVIRSLTIRIASSILLFALIITAVYLNSSA